MGAETPPNSRNATGGGDEDSPPPQNLGGQSAGKMLLSGFSAPKAPRYSGFSMADHHAFALKYNEYVRECQQASDALGNRIMARPVGACIKARTKPFASQMHLGAKVDDVTNGQRGPTLSTPWSTRAPTMGTLVEKIKTKVVLDENDLDLERCHDKWMMAYWGLLERNNMMSFHEKHPKKAVEALVHGIRSLALKQQIKTQLDLDHKHLRIRQG